MSKKRRGPARGVEPKPLTYGTTEFGGPWAMRVRDAIASGELPPTPLTDDDYARALTIASKSEG